MASGDVKPEVRIYCQLNSNQKFHFEFVIKNEKENY